MQPAFSCIYTPSLYNGQPETSVTYSSQARLAVVGANAVRSRASLTLIRRRSCIEPLAAAHNPIAAVWMAAFFCI